jgi:hypothetical protein
MNAANTRSADNVSDAVEDGVVRGKDFKHQGEVVVCM